MSLPECGFSAMVRGALVALAACLAPVAASAETSAAAGDRAQVCRNVGSWVDPSTGTPVRVERLFDSLVEQRVVLLGESHTAAEHHRWQLQMLAGLHARHPALVIGFEMFPRSVQPVLDAWSRGELSESEFLKASRWREVWGYDAELYLPLFHLARQNKLPMVALNVERGLVSRVAQEGWHAISAALREGLSTPAPASESYRSRLADIYLAKQEALTESSPHGDDTAPKAKTLVDRASVLESEKFARFVEAQLTWDRAMAEALGTAAKTHRDAIVVGIIGRGHVEHGHGVRHQLAALGETAVATLLPVNAEADCEKLEAGVADAVFLTAPGGGREHESAKPRLGVMIAETAGGVRIATVGANSIAEQTGLKPGDIVRSAASVAIAKVAELVEIIQRQAPGTWLPLDIERDGAALKLIAKFPPATE